MIDDEDKINKKKTFTKIITNNVDSEYHDPPRQQAATSVNN